MKHYIYLLLFLLCANTSTAQDIVFDDYVYVTNLKSVKFHPQNDPLGMPVTNLKGGSPLVLSFDDMDEGIKDFSYDIIHCDRDWNPSDLPRFDYMEGLQEGDVRNHSPSMSTIVPYHHYEITLPNRFFEWTKSGNYLLVVYENGNDEPFPVITRRFMVADNKVALNAKARRPHEVSKYRTHQLFDISLTPLEDTRIINPGANIYMTLLQNGRWKQAHENIRPLYVRGDDIIMDNKGTYTFPAGNEFRFADIRSLIYGRMGVHSIDLNEDITRVFLQKDQIRKGRPFITNPDANGQFIIDNVDANNGKLTGDYVEVVFTLVSPKYKEDVYVLGAWNDWIVEAPYKMTYNDKHQSYVAKIVLKQGFYDYAYGIAKEDGVDYATIEGNDNKTDNVYQALVYYREPGTRYDQLINYSTFKSYRF